MNKAINRRRVLQAAMASAGMAMGAAPAAASKPKTYVLVHGTWHGGWMWREVADILRKAGHRVFTPTMTGLGERSHLMSPDVGLDTHIQDVENVIRWEELDDVILVGHSFGGITISGVADRMADRLRRIVFFDALVPHEQRLAAIGKDPETGEYSEYFKKRMAKFIDGYQMDFWQEYTLDMLVPKEAVEIRARLTRLITPHPVKQWTDALAWKNGGWRQIPHTYIRPTQQAHRPSSDDMVGPALNNPDWQFISLPVARNGMMTHPKITAECFLSLT